MTELIDISTPVDDRLPVWPGSPGASFSSLLRIVDGDDANATRMDADLHTGTHVDAPLHFVRDGSTLEQMGLQPFVGSAYVADVGDASRVGPDELDAVGLPTGTTRLLLRTSNTRKGLLRTPTFASDAVALTADGAQWVVDHGLLLIGIDYLSIQSVHDGPATHQILLRAGVVILEGLALEAAPLGPSDLVCLPVRLAGTEAAPARAVLFPGGTLS
ncbi:MAG: cyclase family protein [Solirubrobacteraceae bacterium]